MPEGNQAIPGLTGNTTSTPAGGDSDVIGPDFSYRVTPVIGHREGHGVASISLIGVGWSFICADVSIAKVPLIAVGSKTAGNLADSKLDLLAFLQTPPLVSSEFDIKLGLLQTYLNKRGRRGSLQVLHASLRLLDITSCP